MSISVSGKPGFKFVLLWCDDAHGSGWLVQTDREWFDFRLTPTGLVRLGRPHTGIHPFGRPHTGIHPSASSEEESNDHHK